MAKQKTALIIGAGPAGLTAAYELLKQTDIKPIVVEASSDMGGISKTVNYKGNRIDIGGHRFFSKSDRVMAWWNDILPIEKSTKASLVLAYQGQRTQVAGSKSGADPKKTDAVMLVRSRTSRIYYEGKLYNYPLSLDATTINNLGWDRVARMGASYLAARLRPRPEQTLEDFYINRFGKELYRTFFRDYTEKVWGVPCSAISAEWGAQRVKGLSVSKAVIHAAKSHLPAPKQQDITQKGTETSLIEYFLYPKYGPGQMWETVAKRVQAMGGEIITNAAATTLHTKANKVHAVSVLNTKAGTTQRITADYVFSTMPVKELVGAISGTPVPKTVSQVAQKLPYRDFITVGLLLDDLKIQSAYSKQVPDNWIYIQEPGVKVGRLQIFNNWSPYLVKDKRKIWIGMEYFVSEGDELWNMPDKALTSFAINELAAIGIIDPQAVQDNTVIRMKKTYPAYFGSYKHFNKVRKFTDSFDNLFLIGRNGMHRYNNQDHSMLTAMTAVENIKSKRTDKSNIWDINLDKDYHESK